jgi:hypothetical protein
MPSKEAWVQRPSGQIKSEDKHERFNLNVSRAVDVEAIIDNQSKSLSYTVYMFIPSAKRSML